MNERTLAMTYYATEGVPSVAPANVTIPLVTKHSAVVKWVAISADECFGFLRAYRIHYTEILKNFSFDVAINSSAKQYQLKELKAKTRYSVRISGVTGKGEGAQSQLQYFTTLRYDQGELEGIIAGFCLGIILALTIAVILCSLMFKR
ncbi:interleukin-6 receptor subunit beta-like [Varanus komodoensis]|uniref:interleukin-6 receptor subunit beta-like n=1 Tax=Varanus komodoensis TaxID=61221 RepID=UPI001CF7A451|nr:interleukin-6 receptor subunit beta-like [Varanus komodoensis]